MTTTLMSEPWRQVIDGSVLFAATSVQNSSSHRQQHATISSSTPPPTTHNTDSMSTFPQTPPPSLNKLTREQTKTIQTSLFTADIPFSTTIPQYSPFMPNTCLQQICHSRQPNHQFHIPITKFLSPSTSTSVSVHQHAGATIPHCSIVKSTQHPSNPKPKFLLRSATSTFAKELLEYEIPNTANLLQLKTYNRTTDANSHIETYEWTLTSLKLYGDLVYVFPDKPGRKCRDMVQNPFPGQHLQFWPTKVPIPDKFHATTYIQSRDTLNHRLQAKGRRDGTRILHQVH